MRTLLVAIVGLVVALVGQQARALITVGSLDTPGPVSDVAVVGGLAYVADYYSVRVIDFGPEYIQTSEPLPTLSPWSQLALMVVLLGVGLGVWRWRAA